jgi:hypothetical protein
MAPTLVCQMAVETADGVHTERSACLGGDRRERPVANAAGVVPVRELGANVRELRERMGHSSTQAALIYLHAASDGHRRLAAEIDRKPPRRPTTARPNGTTARAVLAREPHGHPIGWPVVPGHPSAVAPTRPGEGSG